MSRKRYIENCMGYGSWDGSSSGPSSVYFPTLRTLQELGGTLSNQLLHATLKEHGLGQYNSINRRGVRDCSGFSSDMSNLLWYCLKLRMNKNDSYSYFNIHKNPWNRGKTSKQAVTYRVSHETWQLVNSFECLLPHTVLWYEDFL